MEVLTQNPTVDDEQIIADAQTVSTPQVQPVPVAVEPTPVVEKLPDNEAILSTGVRVRFKKLNRSTSTDLMIKAFADANLDGDGNIVTDELSTGEQMKLAKNVTEYHGVLIDQGVSLVGKPEDFYEGLGLTKSWVRKLMRSGLIQEEYYDYEDPQDIEILFLRYHAFQSEEDWGLLSSKVLNVS